jgi:hypothetical protein
MPTCTFYSKFLGVEHACFEQACIEVMIHVWLYCVTGPRLPAAATATTRQQSGSSKYSSSYVECPDEPLCRRVEAVAAWVVIASQHNVHA